MRYVVHYLAAGTPAAFSLDAPDAATAALSASAAARHTSTRFELLAVLPDLAVPEGSDGAQTETPAD